MAIEEKAANSRQSVDLKWKLRKALEEQVSEKSDGSGIEFGKDVAVDGKLHVNEFSDIQNAKGEGLTVNMFTVQIMAKSSSGFNLFVSVPVFSLKDSLKFEDVFKPNAVLACSGLLSGNSTGAGYKNVVVSQVAFVSPDKFIFQGLSADKFEVVDSWGTTADKLNITFRDKLALAKPNPGQWDEEE